MKVSVILRDEDAKRFSAYCDSKGYKKSTLIVRLIREHLRREQFEMQRSIFDDVGAPNDSHRET
jgi:hypothetical protein